MEHIQKVDALNRLAVIESEAQKLRAIIEKPEPRTPEAGDVWLSGAKKEIVVGKTENDSFNLVNLDSGYGINDEMTYLGKFDEVYCKRDDFIRDVRDALSHEDYQGETFLEFISNPPLHSGQAKTSYALRELNII